MWAQNSGTIYIGYFSRTEQGKSRTYIIRAAISFTLIWVISARPTIPSGLLFAAVNGPLICWLRPAAILVGLVRSVALVSVWRFFVALGPPTILGSVVAILRSRLGAPATTVGAEIAYSSFLDLLLGSEAVSRLRLGPRATVGVPVVSFIGGGDGAGGVVRSLVVDAGGTRGDGIADLLWRREGAPEGEAEIVSSAVRRRIVLVEVVHRFIASSPGGRHLTSRQAKFSASNRKSGQERLKNWVGCYAAGPNTWGWTLSLFVTGARRAVADVIQVIITTKIKNRSSTAWRLELIR